jgi:hypothetical protein
MLRKLIVLAITSGLAKKAWDAYRARHTGDPAPGARTTSRRAATPRATSGS